MQHLALSSSVESLVTFLRGRRFLVLSGASLSTDKSIVTFVTAALIITVSVRKPATKKGKA